MIFKQQFEAKGNWYKANTHLHTTCSDGISTPEELCDLYRNKGYDFLCITDHHKITTPSKKPKDLLLIPAAEMCNEWAHIVGIGMQEAFDERGLGMSDQQIIDELVKQGALVVIAHPYWNAMTASDLTSLKNYIGIEIFNNHCHISKGKGYSTVQFDEVLQTGGKMLGFAADDSHRERDYFGSFIMVKAENLDITSIMKSISKGCFYSSSGVIIEDLVIDDSKIYISFSPAMSVDFIGSDWKGARISGDGKEIREAEYKIKGSEKYLRIEITDKNNKKGWVNPIYL